MNPKYDVALLTESRYDKPIEIDWYIQNILTEDELLTHALEKLGLKVIRLDWDSKTFDWTEAKVAIFRTTWDYFHRFAEFSKWLNETESKTRFLNPISQIRWNMDKHYLLDLEKKGIHICTTLFMEKGDERGLEEILQQSGWNDCVLKPAVSGAARHTYLIRNREIGNIASIYEKLIREEAMLLQPFQRQVVTKGEVAFMLFGGKFSHAVLKMPKPGDFRVQDDFGGTIQNYVANQEEIEFVEKAFAACSPLPLYGRVDVIWDNEDKLAVSELELIEPELWFRMHPPSAVQMAEAVLRELQF